MPDNTIYTQAIAELSEALTDILTAQDTVEPATDADRLVYALAMVMATRLELNLPEVVQTIEALALYRKIKGFGDHS